MNAGKGEVRFHVHDLSVKLRPLMGNTALIKSTLYLIVPSLVESFVLDALPAEQAPVESSQPHNVP